MTPERRPLAAIQDAWAISAGFGLGLLVVPGSLPGTPTLIGYPTAAGLTLVLTLIPSLALPLVALGAENGRGIRRRAAAAGALWGAPALALIGYVDGLRAELEPPNIWYNALLLPSGAALGTCLGLLVAFRAQPDLGLPITERDALAWALSLRLLKRTLGVLSLTVLPLGIVTSLSLVLLIPGYPLLVGGLLTVPPLAVGLASIDRALACGYTARRVRALGAAVGATWPVAITALAAVVDDTGLGAGLLVLSVVAVIPGALLGLAIAHGPAQLLHKHCEAAPAAPAATSAGVTP